MTLTRQECRAQLAQTMGDGLSGTTTSAGAAGGTTLLDATNLYQADDYWNTGQIVITSGTYIGQVRRISDFTSSTGTVTVSSAFGGQIAASVTFEIHLPFVYALYNDCFRRAVRHAAGRNRYLQEWWNEELTFNADQYEYTLPIRKSVAGTATTGSTTTLTDTADLTEANDFWIGARVVFKSGANITRSRYVSDSTSAGVLTWAKPLPSAVTTETFTIIKFEPTHISRILYEYVDGDWRTIPENHYRPLSTGKLSFTMPSRPGGLPEDIYSPYPDTWPGFRVRLEGYRLPEPMELEQDPCEISEEFLFLYTEYLLRNSLGRRRDIDPEDNRAAATAVRREAELLLLSRASRLVRGARVV